MDLLEPMVIFAKVAEKGAMTAAADALGVSKSLVSKKINYLEDQLQTRLLVRTTRALQLTEEGVRFLEHCRRLTEVAAQAKESLAEHRGHVTGLLRISAPVTFGQAHMQSLVRAFCRQYPDVQIELYLENQKIDLVAQNIDIVVRISHDLPPDHIALPLTTMRETIVTTPAYLERHGAPQTPADLSRHHCLIYLNPKPLTCWWFQKDGVVDEVQVRGCFAANYHTTLLQALLDGGGIARLPSYAVATHIAEGRLVPLLTDYQMPTFPVVLLYAPGSVVPARIRHFARFAQSWFKAQPTSRC